MSCEGRVTAHTCAGRVFCTHVFLKGFGRPHKRARVKEARPLSLSPRKRRQNENKVDGIGRSGRLQCSFC